MLKTKESKGITLIALIITIIVLLILAGVTISAISGNESAMEKASEAREKNEQGAELDAIKLAVVNSVASGLDGLVNAENLKEGLSGIVEDNGRLKIQSDNAPWIVTGKTGMKYKIKQNGEVVSAEPVASVEFVQTEDSISVGKSKKLEIITKGASGNVTEANEVLFTSSNEDIAIVETDGSIKIVNDENKIGETVTISVVADGVNGTSECIITVSAELKIGDYVVISSNQYTPIDENKLSQLNNNIKDANISGYINNSSFTRKNNLKWRVLELDENGNPTKLVSSSTIGQLSLLGANGYNNAVYLLNNLCSTLYSCNLGTTRSMKIEDIEKYLAKDSEGKNIKDNYTNTDVNPNLKVRAISYIIT